MCLIITAPKGNMIPLELLQDASHRNSDGWGVMWHDGEKIHVQKSPLEDAEAIYDIVKNNEHQCVVHLRMATHGQNTEANTHPFEVIPQRLYMMHNGVVDVGGTCRVRSDTRVMVEDFIKPAIGSKPGRLRNLRPFIQNMIGDTSNRLVFLNDRGELTYFNKDLGLEWRGLWCSNTYAWSLHSEGLYRRHSQSYGSGYWDRGGRFVPSVNDDYLNDGTHRPWMLDAPTAKRTPAWNQADQKWQWQKDFEPKHIVVEEDDDTLAELSFEPSFRWAPGNVQAQEVLIPKDDGDDVKTDWSYEIPVWVARMLTEEYDRDTVVDPRELNAFMDYMKDNFTGDIDDEQFYRN